MLKTLCILLVMMLCGCTTHQQRNTFKNLNPITSEIKTYTYEEARDLAEDSEGYYNFFLLPGIDPHQAYTFEQKFAEEQGFGYTVYMGAHPYSVDALVYVDIPVELLEAYVETIADHIQTGASEYSTFRAALTYYMVLRKAMQLQTSEKKHALHFQAEAERVLLGMFLMLEDNRHIDTPRRINTLWRFVDRVKFHMYKKKYKPKGY